MTQNAAVDLSALHTEMVRALSSGTTAAAAIEAASQVAGRVLSDQLNVDRRELRAELPIRVVETMIDLLAAAASDGHSAILRCEFSDAELAVIWTSEGRASLTMSGSARDVVAAEFVAGLEAATLRNDASSALGVLPDGQCVVEIVVRSRSSGGCWVPSAELLAAHLGDGRWGSTLLRLRRRSPGVPMLALVQDAGDSVLTCPGLILAGPDAQIRADLTASPPMVAPAIVYRVGRARGSAAEMPLPGDITPDPSPAGSLEPLRSSLQAAARATCWFWLGRESRIGLDGVRTSFEGVRSLELDLVPYDAASSDAEITLFVWATGSIDPVRDDAIHQAVTFAVREGSDLLGAAGPVLRTARSLHELAGRGAVAEALAARRAAREAAIDAARSAGSAAREVATKSVERTFALLFAATLAVFAHGQELLSAGATLAVVVAVAALALVALYVSDQIEIDSGCRLLHAFDTDSELYREALSEDDVEAVRGMAAIRDARADLGRSRRFVRGLYGGLAPIVLIAGCVLVGLHHP